jgi:hypothetical protein
MKKKFLILVMCFIVFSSLIIQTESHSVYKIYDASSEFTSIKTLRLYKDKSYTYYNWSHTSFGAISDSGSWKIIDTILILQSIKTVLDMENCRKLSKKEKKLSQSEIYILIMIRFILKMTNYINVKSQS